MAQISEFRTKAQKLKIHEYTHLLTERAKDISLVSSREASRVDILIEDSLALSRCWKALGFHCEGRTGVDIGSGGGLPGIVLAIVHEKCFFQLIESNGKKATFLREVVDRLDLKNVSVENERAEKLGREKQFREKAEFITGKAVAPLPILLELALPLLSQRGRCFFHKGPQIESQLGISEGLMEQLGGQLETLWEYEMGERERSVIAVILKTGTTPKGFPRSAQAIRRDHKRLNL